jgi:hypothetical protein
MVSVTSSAATGAAARPKARSAGVIRSMELLTS